MDYLVVGALILVLVAIVTMVIPKPGDDERAQISERLVIEKKKCPPHQWFWQEIVDQDGNKQGERIVCKICGPLSKSLGDGQ